MGLAEEVSAMKAGATPPPPAAPTAGDEVMNSVAPALPKPATQPNLATPSATAAPATPATPSPVSAPAVKPVVARINGQEFTDMDTAMAYANDLAMVNAQLDAENRGIKAGVQAAAPAQPQTPPAKDEYQEFLSKMESKLFENPKEAVQELESTISSRVERKIVAQQQQQQAVTQAWQQFYSENTDLAKSAEVVDYVLQKRWNEIKDLPIKQAYKQLASETRKFLGVQRAEALPGKELPSTPAPTTPAGGTPVATVEGDAMEPIDFIAQVRNLKSRKGSKA